MAIIESTRGNGTKRYLYTSPDKDTLYAELSEFLSIVRVYLSAAAGLKLSEIKIDFALLSEIIVRIDKRKDYFSIFHEDTDMNETKIAALMAYWIVKFRPFSLRETDKLYKSYAINEMLAAFIILGETKEKSKRIQSMAFHIDKDYVKRLFYGLKYWDISKESFMLSEESLVQSMKQR